ncbi:MAG: hypothetical protein RJQ09_18235 [Cyclobacteriaceae bacterium]
MKSFEPQNNLSRKVRTGAVLLTIAITAALKSPLLSPGFELPVPDGPYSIGTIHLQFADSSRIEPLIEDSSSHRQVYAQIWYPAETPNESQTVPYLNDAASSMGIITSLFKLEEGFFSRVERVRTNAYLNSQVSNAKTNYPLLLFQHGYSFWVSQNTPLMEHLASNGYIVASIGHPYETCYSINAVGELTAYSFSTPGLQLRWKEILDENLSEKLKRLINSPFSKTTLAQEKELLQLQPTMTESVKIWSDDASFLLDKLLKLNNNLPLSANRIDEDRIGALGMSFGGAATAQLVNDDRRIKAGINLDGWVYGDLIGHPLNKPFMFINSDNHRNMNEIHYWQSQSETYKVIVAGTKHLDFCDLKLIAPQYFHSRGYMGTIDKSQIIEVMNRLSLSFFEAYLNDDIEKLTETLSALPEITTATRNVKP